MSIPRIIANDPSGNSEVDDEIIFGQNPHMLMSYKLGIKRINENCSRVTRIYGSNYAKFTPEAWSRVGLYIGRNDQITILDLQRSKLTGAKLVMFLKGLKENRSIKTLMFEGCGDFGEDDMSKLSTFFREKKFKLETLILSPIHLKMTAGLGDLSQALLDTNDLERLHLSRNRFGDSVDWVSLNPFFANLHWGNLKELSLAACSIGLKGCNALGQLLQNPDCRLQKIYLVKNRIDNECCSVLANSLQDNKWLECIVLDYNELINADGFTHFLRLVCNTSTIQQTYDSNCTLKNLGSSWGGVFCYRQPLKIKAKNMLRKSLEFNSRGSRREKILHSHFLCNADGKFDMQPIRNLNVKLMPELLSFFKKMKESPVHELEMFRSFHCLIRHWNIPELFGFPSRTKIKVADLEADKIGTYKRYRMS